MKSQLLKIAVASGLLMLTAMGCSRNLDSVLGPSEGDDRLPAEARLDRPQIDVKHNLEDGYVDPGPGPVVTPSVASQKL